MYPGLAYQIVPAASTQTRPTRDTRAVHNVRVLGTCMYGGSGGGTSLLSAVFSSLCKHIGNWKHNAFGPSGPKELQILRLVSQLMICSLEPKVFWHEPRGSEYPNMEYLPNTAILIPYINQHPQTTLNCIPVTAISALSGSYSG